MDCRYALAKLYDYIDGEIGPAEREAIAAHVNACRECFDQFETERLFAEFVERRAPRPEAREEFKNHLLARLARESGVQYRPSSSSTNIINLFNRFALAAGLIMAVGVGAAWLQGKSGPERMSWRTLAGYHHDRIPVEEVGIETADYAEARAFLAAQMSPGIAALLPESAPAGVEVEESCVMPWQGGQLGRLAFEGGQAGGISLFLLPANLVHLSDEPRIRVNDRNYHSVKLGCCRAVCWDNGGEYVCVMLGDCSAGDLLTHAQAWQAGTSRHSGGSYLPGGSSIYTADSGR